MAIRGNFRRMSSVVYSVVTVEPRAAPVRTEITLKRRCVGKVQHFPSFGVIQKVESVNCKLDARVP